MDKEELKKRTKEFSHRCVKLALSLPNTILGSHLQGQLIRSSTSVAANYRAVCVAQSKASFTAKLSIVIEEELIKKELINSLITEAGELTAIFIASRKTIQTK